MFSKTTVKRSERAAQRVTANFALRKGELGDAKADDIIKAIAAVLPPQVHTDPTGHSQPKRSRV